MSKPTHHRETWIDPHGTAWRLERIAGRWQLSRYSPAADIWHRIGRYPTRTAAVEAARDSDR
jgi:hypothetical protein